MDGGAFNKPKTELYPINNRWQYDRNHWKVETTTESPTSNDFFENKKQGLTLGV